MNLITIIFGFCFQKIIQHLIALHCLQIELVKRIQMVLGEHAQVSALSTIVCIIAMF